MRRSSDALKSDPQLVEATTSHDLEWRRAAADCGDAAKETQESLGGLERPREKFQGKSWAVEQLDCSFSFARAVCACIPLKCL